MAAHTTKRKMRKAKPARKTPKAAAKGQATAARKGGNRSVKAKGKAGSVFSTGTRTGISKKKKPSKGRTKQLRKRISGILSTRTHTTNVRK